MESSITTGMIHLDLSEDFDTVSHRMLKLILEDYFGIESTTLKWISTYLENWQFVVQISNSISEIKVINHSVPQGSKLGPIPFHCYVNTLPDNKTKDQNSVLSGYRDDHALTYGVRSENKHS